MNLRVQEKLDEIRDLLEKSSNPYLFFDSDSDGLNSYFCLRKKFENLTGTSITKVDDVQKRALEKLPKNCDLVVFFDTPVICSFMFEEFKRKNIKVIVVDHHYNGLDKLVEEFNVLYFNPLKYDEKDNRPSCYWAYLVAGLKDNLVNVSVGSVSDFFVLDVLHDFYEFDKQNFDLIFHLDDKKREELFDFVLSYKIGDEEKQDLVSEYVQYLSYETNVGKLKIFFDFLFKTDSEFLDQKIEMIRMMSFKDILNEINLGQNDVFVDFSLFLKKLEKHVKKAVEKNDGMELVIYEHRGKTSYSRQISEEISYRLKSAKCIVVIFKKYHSNYVSLSFRGKGGFVVNDLVSASVSGLNGNGGGHKFSAGCGIVKEDYDEFIERFKAAVQKRLS